MWQPSYTIAYVLMAIQSMVMTDEPFRNEPGFEGYSVREKLKGICCMLNGWFAAWGGFHFKKGA